MTGRRPSALTARREALRARWQARLAGRRVSLEARRSALARRRAAHRKPQAPEKGRRRWLLLLLLLFLIPPCAPPVEVAEVSASPAVRVPLGGQAAVAPEPTPGRLARRDRPPFASPTPTPLGWLEAFRLQVAARSPRLAACYDGAARPGALKWTAAVEPVGGRVSDPTLEPTLSSDTLTSAQRTCVLAVLADPPYRLDGTDAASTPSRVGRGVEF